MAWPLTLAFAATLTACGGSGDNSVALDVTFANIAQTDAIMASDGTNPAVEYAPGIWAVHDPNPSLLFQTGQPASAGLEALAEDGDPAAIGPVVAHSQGVTKSGTFASIDGSTYAQTPVGPGDTATFQISVKPGQHLSLATMFAQSNDIFVAGVDIDPLPGGTAAGDVSDQLHYYDAGTEVDQEPGLGPDQAPRQAMANTGAAENGTVMELTGNMDSAGYSYPALADTVKVTITQH